ncbi:MAG: hypothetical protein UV38_C0002G0292 [candidate division TM6 bacterium GW2011_GWE2_42_60]|nr:MAG: hypothetical protein UV38_C0002G0292 [candidate division TM6 bacterium GW2011_GWE2_42_60]HBY05956.1 hypothetical protein [Candidatus Dependentiae bacterium]
MSLLKKTLQISTFIHVYALYCVIFAFNAFTSDSFTGNPFIMCKTIEAAIDKKNLNSACEAVIVKPRAPKKPSKLDTNSVNFTQEIFEKEKRAGIKRIKFIYDLITQGGIFKPKSTAPINPEIFRTTENCKAALFASIYYGKTKDAQKILRLYPELINTIDTQKRSILHTLINGINTKLYTDSTKSNPKGIEKINVEIFKEASFKEWFSLFNFILSRAIELKNAHDDTASESILETIIALQEHMKDLKKLPPEELFQIRCMLEKMYVQIDIQLRVEKYPRSITDEELQESINTYEGSPKHYYPFIKPYIQHQFFFTAIKMRNDKLATLLLKNNHALIFAPSPLNKDSQSAFEYYLCLACRNEEIGTVLTTESFSNLKRTWKKNALHNLFKKILFKRLDQNDSSATTILIKNIPEALTYTENTVKNTPLHIAAEKKQWETITLLIKRGADIYVKNKMNQTPLDKLFDGKKDPFTIVKKLNPDVIKSDTTSKPLKPQDYFKILCRKYISALSPLCIKESLKLSDEEKTNYTRYFSKTPLASFKKLLKKRNQKKLDKEKELEEEQ